VRNPFTILILLAVLIALVLAAGFTYTVFFKDPGHVSRSVTGHSHHSSVESA
jgi:flagellar basal body-associated protein FliL